MENLKIVLLKVSVYIHSLAVFLLIALIQTFSQKTAKNQISGRFPPLPSTRDVLDILLFTSA